MKQQIESIAHETHKPEINSLEGFKVLFDVPQDEIKTEYRKPLKNAPDEIVGIMTKPENPRLNFSTVFVRTLMESKCVI